MPSQYLRKINRLFDDLDAFDSIDDIRQMGSGVHKLSVKMSDFWSHRTIVSFLDLKKVMFAMLTF
ncbi:hypothetical protein [Dyadobacter frigoris]|uniref:hypothetical protein n=1 Tax=Dyadobacter frigoris TaxID=2576211 RepID=UPI002552C629|nr:hypothetical protein [Dyadobacter frigoris]